MKLLVTGFSAFPGIPTNVTDLIVSDWRGAPPAWPFNEMRFEVLPTSYENGSRQICEMMRSMVPDYVLLLGVANFVGTLMIERFALNIDDCPVPDIDGVVRQGRTIFSDGADAIRTLIDIDGLRERLLKQDVDAEISNYAGAYVCNHTYYVALRTAAEMQKPSRVLFIHVPGGSNLASKEGLAELCQQARVNISAVAKSLSSL